MVERLVTVARFTSDDNSNRLAEVAALRGSGQQRLPAEARIARVTVRDVTATLAYRLDAGEHARRRAEGLLAVTELEKLDALLGLPTGLPVRMEALGGHVRRVIGRLPAGCVQVADGSVTRRIVRPLRVDLAVVTPDGEDWRAGLRKAGRFAAYCTRLLAIAGMPDDLAGAGAEAAYCGTGLVVNAATSQMMVVPPQSFTPTAHTAAGWRFTEQAYREIVSRGLV